MNSKSNTFMTVENEKGKTIELELIDKLEVDNKEYVILSQKGSENAFTYRVEMVNGKRDYKSIGDGEEFAKVLKAYNLKSNL